MIWSVCINFLKRCIDCDDLDCTSTNRIMFSGHKKCSHMTQSAVEIEYQPDIHDYRKNSWVVHLSLEEVLPGG